MSPTPTIKIFDFNFIFINDCIIAKIIVTIIAIIILSKILPVIKYMLATVNAEISIYASSAILRLPTSRVKSPPNDANNNGHMICIAVLIIDSLFMYVVLIFVIQTYFSIYLI